MRRILDALTDLADGAYLLRHDAGACPAALTVPMAPLREAARGRNNCIATSIWGGG